MDNVLTFLLAFSKLYQLFSRKIYNIVIFFFTIVHTVCHIVNLQQNVAQDANLFMDLNHIERKVITLLFIQHILP